jgi:hypothetical protein
MSGPGRRSDSDTRGKERSVVRTLARVLLISLAGLLLVALAVLVVVTNTPWGREHIREIVLDQLEDVVQGRVEIGGLEGNLLRRIQLRDVVIEDAEGRPFVQAEEVSFRYSLSGLFRQRIILNDLNLSRGHIVLDDPPDEDWNFVRIFSPDPTEEPVEREESGWGTWLELRDLEISESSVTLRMEWEADEDPGEAERAEQVRRALAGETRERVSEVTGGYQSVMEFEEVNALMSRVLVAHPDIPDVVLDVERLSLVALPFQPPAARLDDLSGVIRLGEGSVEVQDLSVTMPNSHIEADGLLTLDDFQGHMEVRAEYIELADFRFLHPPLPAEVEGRAEAIVTRSEGTTRLQIMGLEVEVGDGSLEGEADVALGEALRVERAQINFAGISTRLLDEIVPDLDLPAHGELTGRVEGGEAFLEVHGGGVAVAPGTVGLDAQLRFDDERGGTSLASARGAIEVPADLEGTWAGRVTLGVEGLETDLVRAFVPDLPLQGEVDATATVEGSTAGPVDLDARILHRDPVVGVSEVGARGMITLEEVIRLDAMELRFEPVRPGLLRGLVEDIPMESTVAGTVRLDGVPTERLSIESDLAVDDGRGGVGEVRTAGAVGLGDDLAFHDFQVEVAELGVQILAGFVPDLPVGGTLDAAGQLDGSIVDGLSFQADLAHTEGSESSRVEVTGDLATRGEGRVSILVDLHEVALSTLGPFVPEAELVGIMTGELQADGTLNDLRLRADLALPREAELLAEGHLDLSAEEPAYSLRLQVANLDPAGVSGRISEAPVVDGIVALGVDDAVVTVDTLDLRTGSSEIQVSGSFGLSAERSGQLDYRVALDSLHVFAPLLPLEEGTVDPRPDVLRSALDEREAELLEALQAGEVEFLATGQAPDIPEPTDTLGITGIRTDALSGRIEAGGRILGNVEAFDVEGDLEVEELFALGQHVGRAAVVYSARGIGSPGLTANVDVVAGPLLLAGFGYDNLVLTAGYQQRGLPDEETSHTASAALDLTQDDETRITFAATSDLDADGVELELEDVALYFEDASYTMSQPARMRWSDAGLAVDGLTLEGDSAALIRVNGELPAEGNGELDIAIEAMQVAHLQTLLQAGEGIRGRLWLEAPVHGTLASPVFEATATLTDLEVDGTPMPDTRAHLAYADRELAAEAFVEEEGERMLVLEAELPLDLALVDAAEPRLLDGPIRVEAEMLELSLDGLDAWSDQVEGLQGTVAGHFTLSGTYEAPETAGAVEMRIPSVYIVPLEIRVRDIAGTLHLDERTVTLDSLVAHSRGPIRVTGDLDLTELAEPAFDLAIEARDAQVINTGDARLRVDADLTVSGPFDGVLVAGEVRTRSGVIRIPETRELAEVGPLDLEDPATFERVDQILVEARNALIEPSPLVEELRVEVALHIDRDLWIRSQEANVELHTPPAIGPLTIRMQGPSVRNLSLEGTVNTDRGEYEFMGRRFNIARGAVTFIGDTELDPLIRLTAEHEVQLPGREAFDIRIIVDGTITDLTTEFESTAQPPPSQTDLLSLVVFGRDAGSLLQQSGTSLSGQGSSGGPLVGSVAARATQQFATVGIEAMLKELETETARELGLDVLHIQPADTPSEIFTGRALDVLRGTEIQAGRYVTSSLFVSAQARPTFVHPGARMEYQTDDGYVWRASWRPRFLPSAPSLAPVDPDRASVLGVFLSREWRF